MSKFIVTAMKNVRNQKTEVEVAVDLKEVTGLGPMICACERDGVNGVVLLVKSEKNPPYALFIELDTFVEFMAWDILGFRPD